MNRLTGNTRNFDGTGFAMESLVNDNGILTDFADKVLSKLADYEDAEEQGLLLRLPVAIGSTIYHFEYPTRIDDKGTEWSVLDKKRATIKPMKFALCHLNGIGKLYFLTKEEAEQALADMQGV